MIALGVDPGIRTAGAALLELRGGVWSARALLAVRAGQHESEPVLKVSTYRSCAADHAARILIDEPAPFDSMSSVVLAWLHAADLFDIVAPDASAVEGYVYHRSKRGTSKESLAKQAGACGHIAGMVHAAVKAGVWRPRQVEWRHRLAALPRGTSADRAKAYTRAAVLQHVPGFGALPRRLSGSQHLVDACGIALAAAYRARGEYGAHPSAYVTGGAT